MNRWDWSEALKGCLLWIWKITNHTLHVLPFITVGFLQLLSHFLHTCSPNLCKLNNITILCLNITSLCSLILQLCTEIHVLSFRGWSSFYSKLVSCCCCFFFSLHDNIKTPAWQRFMLDQPYSWSQEPAHYSVIWSRGVSLANRGGN